MTDTLTLKEVELDYEADEGDDGRVETPSSPRLESKDDGELSSPRLGDDPLTSPKDEENELESGEELEDGEISDEDETLKNERNEPKPVCRFYSKGQCTWGSSCRFLHPGVLDKGNYSMFATPRPILPGEPDQEEAGQKKDEVVEPVMIRPPPPAYETAWERGLRQAKEMRRRSHKRREMDVEYEEKKASLSLTQIELDKENDYYARPASPAHTHDPYADDEYGVNYNTYPPESRRIAPPPPADFVARTEAAAAGRRYSESPPPRMRRVAPPRSPSPSSKEDAYRQRFRGGEDWADPWMRSKDEKPRGRTRRRSYSSGSSRSSSSRSSGSRSSSIRRRKRYSSSGSSSSRSRSRSKSSSPEGIPRRTGHAPLPPTVKNTAPLQKRLAAVTNQKPAKIKLEGVSIKLEGEKKHASRGEQNKTSHKEADDKSKEPFKMNLPKNQVKMTLKTVSGKPVNQTVLEKLGTAKEDLDSEKRKRKLQDPAAPETVKQRKLENQELMETLKQRLKTNLEVKQAKEAEAKLQKEKKLQEVIANEKKVDKGDKKKKVGGGGEAKTKRKEELQKQLKAVEDAIRRKRTKLDK